MTIKNNNFSIAGQVNNDKLNLKMTVFQNKHIYTNTLSSMTSILNEKLPSIFECECFNEENKHFNEECKNTELGHLFEHVMLEYLCISKLNAGCSEAIYEGFTNWNWEQDQIGTFNIEIKVGSEDIEFIERAFQDSVNLLVQILTA